MRHSHMSPCSHYHQGKVVLGALLSYRNPNLQSQLPWPTDSTPDSHSSIEYHHFTRSRAQLEPKYLELAATFEVRHLFQFASFEVRHLLTQCPLPKMDTKLSGEPLQLSLSQPHLSPLLAMSSYFTI